VTANTWTEFDVSALVSENGSYSFDLVAESADGVDFMSRQSSSLRKPQLVITTEHMGPETTIESGPSGTTTSASAGFSFSSPGDLSASFQCRLDDGPWEGCVSPKQYSSLADGPHSFEVRARDGSGATDPMPARRDWTVDTESVLWAVGDGNAGSNSLATANRMTGPLDALLYLGDVYETGTAEEFATNFDPVWGRFKSVTSPTPGNHDWTNLATGYDPYWGSRAPQTNGGHWYSFVEKGWEIISLNSEGESMAAGSAQWGWLRDRLASGGNCRIVFFHRPRYAAGLGEFPGSQAIWDLMANKVLFVLNGHAHSMQRSHPVNGVTEFISGGGGEGLTEADELDNRFAYVNDREFGSLKITLTRVGSNPDGGATAAHRFIAADDGSTLDSGSRTCTPSQ
jgi:hypothetical protein